MGELQIIKGIMYNKDGTVEYVFDDAKLEEVIAPLTNENNNQTEPLLFAKSQECELSFDSVCINDDILYQLGVIHWYDWFNDKIYYNFREDKGEDK